MVRVTLGPGGERQLLVFGSVSQMVRVTGTGTPPVSAVAVIEFPAPMLTVATAKTPVLVVPGMLTIPASAAASATTSATGLVDAERSSVLTPVMTGADAVLVQLKLKRTSVAANAALGVIEITYVCRPPAGMSTAVLGEPVTALVLGSVVWNDSVAGSVVSKPMPQLKAVTLAGLMIVAKAVAVADTSTERLDGKTDASTATGAHPSGSSAKSKTPVPFETACTHTPAGVMARAFRIEFVRPVLNAAQLAPALTLLNTPPPVVLA